MTEGHYYFDGAGKAMLPRESVHAGVKALQSLSQPWTVPGHEGLMQDVKQIYVQLLGVGAPDDVAVTPSTSYALSLVAASLHLRPGQQVVVLEAQSASNVMQWQECVRRCPGSVFTAVERPARSATSDVTWTDAVIAAILERDTAVVALPNVHWTDGWRIDLQPISDTCRQAGALLCLDLTQSLGVLPFNGARVRPAVVACSVHKWLHGAHGVSLLYVDPDVLPSLAPLEQHERNRAGSQLSEWDDVGTMTRQGYPTAYFPGARRLDAGGRPSPTTLAVLHASITLVASWQATRIATYCQPLLARIVKCARELGFTVPPKHAPHMVGLRKPCPVDGRVDATGQLQIFNLSADSFDMAQLRDGLKRRNIHCSLRAGALRLSVFLYTTHVDVSVLCKALQEVTHQLAPLS